MTARTPRELTTYARKVDIEELARLRAAGRTLREIAEHFDVTIRSISRNLAERGLSQPGPHAGKRVGKEWKEAAAELLDGGASLVEVARSTDVSYCTVLRHFPGRGWDSATTGQYANAIRKANRELARLGVSPLPPSTSCKITA